LQEKHINGPPAENQAGVVSVRGNPPGKPAGATSPFQTPGNLVPFWAK
jgi:hypothetical protein